MSLRLSFPKFLLSQFSREIDGRLRLRSRNSPEREGGPSSPPASREETQPQEKKSFATQDKSPPQKKKRIHVFWKDLQCVILWFPISIAKIATLVAKVEKNRDLSDCDLKNHACFLHLPIRWLLASKSNQFLGIASTPKKTKYLRNWRKKTSSAEKWTLAKSERDSFFIFLTDRHYRKTKTFFPFLFPPAKLEFFVIHHSFSCRTYSE